MIYTYDFFFVVIFLALRDLGIWLLDNQYEIYIKVRKWYLWTEFSYIVLGVYFIPEHKLSEALVAFFVSLCTKLTHDIVFKKSNSTLTKFEKHFNKSKKTKL